MSSLTLTIKLENNSIFLILVVSTHFSFTFFHFSLSRLSTTKLKVNSSTVDSRVILAFVVMNINEKISSSSTNFAISTLLYFNLYVQYMYIFLYLNRLSMSTLVYL